MQEPESGSSRDTLERLVRLETKICLKFEELEKAIVLAREISEKDKVLARETIDARLQHMNEFQRRMEKLEGTFITQSCLDEELRIIQHQVNLQGRLIYIGVGIVIAIQFIVHFLGRG